MKKVKFGMRSAYLILASVFLILVNLTLGLVLTNVSQKALIAQIEGRMLDIANTAADMINGDELERLTKNDVETKEFQDVVNTLIGFQSNIQLEYIYCIQDLGNKQFAFSVDPTVDDPGGFGDPVVYTDALYQASLGKASVDKVPYEDSWGRFYSAYSPVINSKGKVAGIVAVDFSAEWYDKTVSTQARIILIICGLSLLAGGLIVIILTEHSRRRNHKLYAQLNALADNVEDLVREVGNTTHTEQYLRTHTIRTDSGDGIRDLNQKIQSMQEDLRMEIASVHRMAFIDALTAVGNKAAYMEAVELLTKEPAESEATSFSIATFDMNGLKQINDTYGHEFGDIALVDAANALITVFGKDNIYRIGGDEFIVLLPTNSAEELDGLFAKLDAYLEEKNKQEAPYHFPLLISKGYAIYQKDSGDDFQAVYRRADEAMYRDKDTYYEQNGNSGRR